MAEAKRQFDEDVETSDLDCDYPRMKGRVPTRVGDVLILETHKSFTIYVVGRVLKDWQKDFEGGQLGRAYEATEPAALAAGKRLLATGSRIFMLTLETGEWLLMN